MVKSERNRTGNSNRNSKIYRTVCVCCWCFGSIVLFCPRSDKAYCINDEEANTHTYTHAVLCLVVGQQNGALLSHLQLSAVSSSQSSEVIPPLGGQRSEVTTAALAPMS